MTNSRFVTALLVPVFALCCAFPATLAAQHSSAPERVISIDPYGLANRRLTAEAEFCDRRTPEDDMWFGCSLTVGLAATIEHHPRPDGSKAPQHHVDTEGFIRVGARHRLTGWWLGLRTGLTFADRFGGVGPSLGIDTGVSWLIARRVYLGTSVGAKTVFGLDADADLRYNPSLRIAAGYAF